MEKTVAMKLIKNLVVTRVGDEYLLINTLNGLVDKINQDTFDILKKWKCDENVDANTTSEKELYDSMNERGYFCVSEEAEHNQKSLLVRALREKEKKKKGIINTITFVLTYNCNFRCPYCFEELDNDLRGLYINEAQVDAALSLAGKELKHIGLFGGEPLLPQNRAIIEYIIKKAPDKSYDVITNGYYLDKYINLFSRIKVNYIMVTIDGTKSIHDKRRVLLNGAPTFDRIISNIHKCLENGIPIRIRMNVDKDTIVESDKLRNEILDNFQEYINLLSFEISPMMDMNFTEKNEMYNILLNSDATYPEELHNLLLSRFSPIVNSLLHGYRLLPTYSYCAGHQNTYIFDPLGLIYPCLIAVGKREFSIGTYFPNVSFFNNSIKERNIDTIEKCRECQYSLICGGGCPLKLADCSDIYQPECHSIINDVHNLIPLLLK